MAISANAYEWPELEEWLRENVASLQTQWSLPGVLADLIEVNTSPNLETYDGGYRFRIPMDWAPGHSVTSGKPGPHKKGKAGSGYLYPKKTYTSVEMDEMTAAIGRKGVNNVPGIPNQLVKQMASAHAVLKFHAERIHWGDGTGRLALISDITNFPTYSILKLKAVYTNRANYPKDATKWLRASQPVAIADYDESDEDSGAVVQENQTVLEVHKSAVAGQAYIKVSPACDESVTTGMWVCLYGAFKEEPVGIMGWCGDGTITGANYPRYGLKKFAEVDSSVVDYAAWKSLVYNTITELHADPTAQVTLDAERVDAFVGMAHDNAPGHASLKFDCILASNRVQTKYMKAASSGGSRIFADPEWHPNLGFAAPYYLSAHGDGNLPIITDPGCPEGSLFFVSLGDLMPAQVMSEWVKGDVYTYFKQMLPITGEDILRAFFHHYGFFAVFHRFAHAAIHNINITPAAIS